MSEQPLVTVRAGARANDELKPRTIQVRPLHLRGMDLLELVEEPGVLGRWCGETPVRVRLGYIPGSLAKKPHTYVHVVPRLPRAGGKTALCRHSLPDCWLDLG